MKRRKKIITVTLVCLLLFVLLIPYAKVEVLTLLYKDEFENLYSSNSMISEIEYLKVMNISKTSAEIYYVTKDKKAGFIYEFEKSSGVEWSLDVWDVVWSSSGSADRFIWPYYR